jgi:tRNA threonylcarbamoyl adenosine modification protein YeaZ
MQLAIDTSTSIASLALIRNDRVIAELTWQCEQNHTTQLLVHLAHLLKKTKVKLESTDSIIVARGPGSYNGLRVGISTAKGLAFSLGVPIIGISSLEAEAYQYAVTGLPICPIFSAGRQEIATSMYQKKQDKWQQLAKEQITTVEALCLEIRKKTIFCGEFVSSIAIQLTKQLNQKAVIPSPLTSLRRASFLAELGLKRLKASDYDNPSTLQPLYLRQPAITHPKHR